MAVPRLRGDDADVSGGRGGDAAVPSETFGNPSGAHAAARAAKTALEEAREQIAAVLGAEPSEIVFTGGGTEADNLAVKGAARAARDAGEGDGVVTTAFEHKGVLAPCDRLERERLSGDTRAVSTVTGSSTSTRSRPRSTTARSSSP